MVLAASHREWDATENGAMKANVEWRARESRASRDEKGFRQLFAFTVVILCISGEREKKFFSPRPSPASSKCSSRISRSAL